MSVPCCSSLPSHFQWIHRNLCCFLHDIPLPSLHLLIPPPLLSHYPTSFPLLPPLHLSARSLSLFLLFFTLFYILCFSSLLPFTFSPDYLFPSLFPFHSLQSFLSPLFFPSFYPNLSPPPPLLPSVSSPFLCLPPPLILPPPYLSLFLPQTLPPHSVVCRSSLTFFVRSYSVPVGSSARAAHAVGADHLTWLPHVGPRRASLFSFSGHCREEQGSPPPKHTYTHARTRTQASHGARLWVCLA